MLLFDSARRCFWFDDAAWPMRRLAEPSRWPGTRQMPIQPRAPGQGQ
jgi:hypothetical protein